MGKKAVQTSVREEIGTASSQGHVALRSAVPLAGTSLTGAHAHGDVPCDSTAYHSKDKFTAKPIQGALVKATQSGYILERWAALQRMGQLCVS